MLIFVFSLSLGLHNILFPSLPTKAFYTLFLYTAFATFPAHLIYLDFTYYSHKLREKNMVVGYRLDSFGCRGRTVASYCERGSNLVKGREFLA
jgi:hypothetical protein